MEDYQAVCFYCSRLLPLDDKDGTRDYSCVKCGRLACDDHNVPCQDCDFNACSNCMASHLFGGAKLPGAAWPMPLGTFNRMVVADIEWIVERLTHLSARLDKLDQQN